MFSSSLKRLVISITAHWPLELLGAGVAQLVSALPSVLEVLISILSDSTVCFNFPLICAASAFNTRKMEP